MKKKKFCVKFSSKPVQQRIFSRVHPGGFWVRGASGVSYTLQQPGRQSSDETRGRRHHGPPTPPPLQRTKSRSAVQCGKEPHYALSGTHGKITCFLSLCPTNGCVGGAPRILFSITVVCSKLKEMKAVDHQRNVYFGICFFLWWYPNLKAKMDWWMCFSSDFSLKTIVCTGFPMSCHNYKCGLLQVSVIYQSPCFYFSCWFTCCYESFLCSGGWQL